jgi:hypothetical protein
MNPPGRTMSFRFGLLTIAALTLAAIPLPASAAKPAPSLDVVPADAAFYASMLRNREQFDAIANSKAAAKIQALPYFQLGLTMLKAQAADPTSPAGQFKAAWDDPDIRQSLNFAADLFSDEVFVYGGSNFNSVVELFQEVYGEMYWASLMQNFQDPRAGNRGAMGPGENEKLQARLFIRALVKQGDRIKFPDLVAGFKVKDKVQARKQLLKLESILKKAVAQVPPLADRLQQKSVAGRAYLTLSLDGSLIPWDAEVLDTIRGAAETPAEGDKLIERLKAVTLTIALGMRDDYLLLAIGPSTDVLAQLGSGAALRSSPELAAVDKYAEKRICAVSYSSAKWNAHFGQTKKDVDELLQVVRKLLPSLPADLRADVAKDAAGLAEDFKKMIPRPGATSSIAFLTESGIEGYDYDWSDLPQQDGSKPLDLLKHVGGTPVLFAVGRTKGAAEGFEKLVKWLGVGRRYFEQYGLAQMPPPQRAQFEEFYGKVKPLLGRVGDATRSLIPALDGQAGLVIDAKLTSRRFVRGMPVSQKPMPMLEPAILVGVSDSAKVQKAFTEYYAVADDFVEVLKELPGPGIPPDFKIQRPTQYTFGPGVAYAYLLPIDWGVDTKVQPNAGLSDKIAVLSLSQKHTVRLMEEKEPMIAGIKLSTDRPLSAAAGLDFATLVDSLNPWVEFALQMNSTQMSPDMVDAARTHAKVVMEVLKAYRGTVSETYLDDKVTVTHSQSIFQDVGP